MKRILRSISIFVSFLALLTATASSRAEDLEQIRVGFLPALTGPFADVGSDCARGVAAAKKIFTTNGRIGKREIVLVPGDSQADPKVGLNEFRRLVDQEKVIAVITMRSSVGMPLNPISKQKHIPLLGSVGHPQFVPQNEYAFQFWPISDVEGGTLASYLIAENIRSVGVITAQDEWNVSLSKGFQEAFVRLGGTVLAEENVHGTEVDVSPLLARYRAKKPAALFINLGVFPGAAAIKRVREQWPEVRVFSNYWSAVPAAITAATPQFAEGVMYPEISLKLPKFLEALSSLGDAPRPSAITFTCFSAYSAVVAAVRSESPLKSGEDFLAAMNTLRFLQLPDGDLELRDRRAQYHMVMKRITGGGVEELP